MVEWEYLVNLADGTMVQVLGNMRGGMGKKSRKKRIIILGIRMGREFHLGLKKFLGQMAVQLKNSFKLSRVVLWTRCLRWKLSRRKIC